MKKGLASLLAFVVAAAPSAFGQEAAPVVGAPVAAPVEVMQEMAPVVGSPGVEECCLPGARAWGSVEWLQWFVKNGPMPVPVLTTGIPRNAFPGGVGAAFPGGALGQPGTVVLFGGKGLDYGPFNGVRMDLGTWLNDARNLGFEVRAFVNEERAQGTQQVSARTGTPLVNRPFFNQLAGGEGGFLDAYPNTFAGGAVAASRTQLWGFETNALAKRWDCEAWTGKLLAGFRYLDLDEELTISDLSLNYVPNLNQGAFGIAPRGAYDVVNDRFSTRSQFYGGQVGASGERRYGRWTVGGGAKLGAGAMHNIVDIGGNFTVYRSVGAALQTLPGGILTAASNIGRYEMTQFAWMPEVSCRFGYQLTRSLRAYAGYDFLYVNGVVRPGEQVDHFVDIRQQPLYRAVPVPASRPTPLLQESDFWVQGASFGLEFKY